MLEHIRVQAAFHFSAPSPTTRAFIVIYADGNGACRPLDDLLRRPALEIFREGCQFLCCEHAGIIPLCYARMGIILICIQALQNS